MRSAKLPGAPACESLVYHGTIIHKRLDLSRLSAAEDAHGGSPVRIIDQSPFNRR
jgi:hypothetical protein